MELSEKLFQKWKDLMIKKYGFRNPARSEVVEFASALTRYFKALTEELLKN